MEYIAQGLGLILDSFQSSKGTEVNKLPPPVVGELICFSFCTSPTHLEYT